MGDKPAYAWSDLLDGRYEVMRAWAQYVNPTEEAVPIGHRALEHRLQWRLVYWGLEAGNRVSLKDESLKLSSSTPTTLPSGSKTTAVGPL